MKPKLNPVFLSLFLFTPMITISQAWDFVYDSINTMGRQVILTNDGCFLATAVNDNDEHASLSIKLDQDGNILWMSPNGGYSVTQTFDNKFVIAGCNHPRAVLKKIDEDGNLEWYRTYGEGSQEEYSAVIQSSDSGLVACGFTKNHGDSTFLVRKTDQAGNVLWTTCFHSMYGNVFRDVIEHDYHYYVVGKECAVNYPPNYLIIAKITMSGVPRWCKIYEMGFTGYSVKVNKDGELVVAGGNMLTWLNTDGDTLRTKVLNSYLDVRSIDITPENGYIIAGTNESFYSVNFLSELDETGERIWYHGYPTVAHAYWGCFESVNSIDQGGFLAGGYSLYTNQNHTRLRVIRTDESGGILVGTEENSTFQKPMVYPNPTSGRFRIHSTGVEKIEIFDNRGRLISTLLNRSEQDLGNLDNGLYILRIFTFHGIFTEKMVKR